MGASLIHASSRARPEIVGTPGPAHPPPSRNAPGYAGTWIDQVESLHDDHLGSTHVVTNESGDVVRTASYDAWGQARDGENWLASLDPDDLGDLGIGFTGHPARLDADLVDMGGRSYHPRLGRFFSPDPLVVSPLDAQAHNRYSYVHNRPLVATDPTGYGTDLGADSGSSGSGRLPRSCADAPECQRYIVVADPDGASSLDQWNRSLAWFESQNGPGQGGPGTGNPYSANGVRHGTDAGQPGGTGAFTIAVTPDMCAEIAACSGRQSKQAPVYVWDAPIDDWARTAVDVATDFIPVVTHVKSAYDAFDRLQNGEDPVDVLMAAGGDALLGIIPGLKVGKKAVGKALDKVDDVADAAGDVGDATKKTRARRNGHLAGKEHPETSVPFDSNGHPDFSRVSRKNVKIEFSGNRPADVRRANKAAGFESTPEGYVWHHHQDGTTMQLVPRDLHMKSGHDGGFSGR